MARKCTICNHPQKSEIDAAILREEPFRNIAKHFGTSLGAIHRHKNGCMRDVVEAGRVAGVIASASEIQDRIEGIISDLDDIAKKAKEKEKYGPAVSAKRAELDALKMLVPQGGDANRPDDGLISALRNVAETLDWGEEEGEAADGS